MFGFGKKKNETIGEALFSNPCEEKKKESIKKVEPVEEWIWVNGYKATEKDMTCRGYQYEMNKVFDISEDKPVTTCEHGFHMCLYMRDVRKYYEIGRGHRFFEVKALVRKKDYHEYGTVPYDKSYSYLVSLPEIDKLVAKSIIFTRELTVDEILEPTCAKNWADEYKQLAMEIGLSAASLQRKVDILTKLGYSETFARAISGSNNKVFEIAEAVGSQPDLSMDMKVWTIFNSVR
jgi:hypothetical protein